MILEYILLAMLREPKTGYTLKNEFDQGERHFWSAELSQIYPALQRMEKRGWLKSTLEPSDKGPERRVYSRTKAGAKALSKWLRSDPIVGMERFAYIAQLIYMDQLDDLDVTLRFLKKLRDLLADKLELLSSAETAMAALPGFPNKLNNEDFHGRLSLRMGVLSLSAKVQWCDESIQRVSARLAKERKYA